MRKTLFALLTMLSVFMFTSCGDDATRPGTIAGDGTIRGEIGDADFEFEIPGGPGAPLTGPFLLRGRNLHYDDQLGALVVDLTVRNLGAYPHPEPVGLTFIRLDPDEVTVLNPDNNIHGDGAAITFHFANDDLVWTPGETSLPRTVQFGVSKGVAIAFVARLDIGPATSGGTIAGRVWVDIDRDGTMEDNEPGMPRVGVYLGTFGGEDSTATREFARTETDADGRYAFPNLRAGAYVVSVAPSTIGFVPTTPTEIHVLLVADNGGVSSYMHANFGGVPHVFFNQRVLARGKFQEPELLASSVEPVHCDSIPADAGIIPDIDCVGGTLRGTVAEVKGDRNVLTVRVMNTWFLVYPDRIPIAPQAGQRVQVRVTRNEWWVAGSITPWREPQDEILGVVEAVDMSPNGPLPWRIRVMGTWITLNNLMVGER